MHPPKPQIGQLSGQNAAETCQLLVNLGPIRPIQFFLVILYTDKDLTILYYEDLNPTVAPTKILKQPHHQIYNSQRKVLI